MDIYEHASLLNIFVNITDILKILLRLLPLSLTFSLCIAEFGEGWGPAVINSASELILIHEIQKKMNDSHSYWIGGSTFVEHGESVTFYDYMTTSTGNEMFYSNSFNFN